MARKLRVEFSGAIYHVTIRGVERRRLFDDDGDRERFVDRLGRFCEELDVRCYLFCLMRNHAHLLVETPGGNLGKFMHRLQTAYTVYYNQRHRRAGHLFQGRYKAILVSGDEYLLKLSRYIHLNPVQVGTAKALELKERLAMLRDYRWSSYPGYIGRWAQEGFVEEHPILEMVGETKRREAYRRFVEAGLAENDEVLTALLKNAEWGIGSEAFRAANQDRYADRVRACNRKEDASFRGARARVLKPEAILGVVSEALGLRGGWVTERGPGLGRCVAAAMLGKYGGLSQRETAKFVGVGTGAAVSFQLRRLEAALVEDKDLAERMEYMEGVLGGLLQKDGASCI